MGKPFFYKSKKIDDWDKPFEEIKLDLKKKVF